MKIRDSRTLRRFVSFLNSKLDDGAVRQPNTAGLRSKLNRSQQHALYLLSESAGYQTLLDVIEMACVEQDTRLINTDAAHPEDVLNEHRMSKAFWQIFVAIQKKVEYERGEYLGQQQPQQTAMEDDQDVEDTEILQ